MIHALRLLLAALGGEDAGMTISSFWRALENFLEMAVFEVDFKGCLEFAPLRTGKPQQTQGK